MKRLATAAVVIVLALAGSTSIAGAVDPPNQPGQGERSADARNEAGTGAGPHCHVLTDSNGPFTVRVFPSHTGHAHAGGDVFTADGDCDGEAGVQTAT
jgi:hypothetical protein